VRRRERAGWRPSWARRRVVKTRRGRVLIELESWIGLEGFEEREGRTVIGGL
jgi:hypothetical protein